MEPAPTEPVPFICGGHSPVGAAAHGGPVRRLDRRGRLQRGGGVDAPRRAARRARKGRAGQGGLHRLPVAQRAAQTSTSTAASPTAGVTDFVCAPWMFVDVRRGRPTTRRWPPAWARCTGSPRRSSPRSDTRPDAPRSREESHVKTMKIGLQMGYWGAGPPPNAVELVMEADRLGYDSVWTAESYGSDALTPLAWWGSQTERVRLGTSLVPALGAHADGHGHGGADPGPPLGRALRARPRASRAPGGRGLVRPALPRPPGPHPRVRRRRAPGARPREAGDQRRPALPAAVSGRDRTGQAAQVDRAPAAGRHPDHSGSGGAEERRPGGGDRRRLVPHLLLPERDVLLRGVARRGLRPARRPGARADGLRGAGLRCPP